LQAAMRAAANGEPIVFAGRLIDDLIARAQAGDQEAWARIRRMLPRDDPPAQRIQHRDATLRRLCDRLRMDGISDRCIATLLVKVGRHCEQRRDPLPPSAPFDRLDRIERSWVEAEIRKLLALLPDDDWPSAERIRKILKDD
jgi:hypothetical protein